jgi:hypothetical protein
VCLRRTCGQDQSSGTGPAVELRRHVHDDGGMAARSRPTRLHLQHRTCSGAEILVCIRLDLLLILQIVTTSRYTEFDGKTEGENA